MSFSNVNSIAYNIPPLLGPPYVILSGTVTIEMVDVEAILNTNEDVIMITDNFNIKLNDMGLYLINVDISLSFINILGDNVYLSILDINNNSTNSSLIINLIPGSLHYVGTIKLIYNNIIKNNIINLQLTTIHGIAFRINKLIVKKM